MTSSPANTERLNHNAKGKDVAPNSVKVKEIRFKYESYEIIILNENK